ncbi:phosphogluconate dehydrogenase (NAD(+)-dependent, decarboxylating) [Erysipelothrix urinaevulpis]|uniref:phosphogluconate dehydrogenase (NAD(+)-dependent, decarboxylating) n=1 Tax=Erysipelothrix urinaevulpis TaxID=2683717 RepID=UPI00135BE0F6|nr:decarboxylating 6-phosphogluconate dehydrogenase [Erysipelothrix urinaevulpis]
MKVGIIGLGKMGYNIGLNMLNHNIDVVGYDIHSLEGKIEKVNSLEQLISVLPKPRIVWLMVPAGDVTNGTIKKLSVLLENEDIVIDGGNSFYKDSIENYKILKEKNIHFFDCGTSGGISGALNGGNFMIGGDLEAFHKIEPIFQAIAQENGYLYTGESGSGHYLKMIHNGIEYGMMQSIGEGFSILEAGPYDYKNDEVAKLWNSGSVIRSWLMELAQQAFNKDEKLSSVTGTMYSSGEGKWTVQEALDLEISAPVITTSLLMRYQSQDDKEFSGKVVASLRNEFGGHAVEKNTK